MLRYNKRKSMRQKSYLMKKVKSINGTIEKTIAIGNIDKVMGVYNKAMLYNDEDVEYYIC